MLQARGRDNGLWEGSSVICQTKPSHWNLTKHCSTLSNINRHNRSTYDHHVYQKGATQCSSITWRQGLLLVEALSWNPMLPVPLIFSPSYIYIYTDTLSLSLFIPLPPSLPTPLLTHSPAVHSYSHCLLGVHLSPNQGLCLVPVLNLCLFPCACLSLPVSVTVSLSLSLDLSLSYRRGIWGRSRRGHGKRRNSSQKATQ